MFPAELSMMPRTENIFRLPHKKHLGNEACQGFSCSCRKNLLVAINGSICMDVVSIYMRLREGLNCAQRMRRFPGIVHSVAEAGILLRNRSNDVSSLS